MKSWAASLTLLMMAGCGNPGGISDAEYEEYKQLGAPKILYSCSGGGGDDVQAKASFNCGGDRKSDCYKKAMAEGGTVVKSLAGIGAAVTYNKLLGNAKESCNGGSFKILDSKS